MISDDIATEKIIHAIIPRIMMFDIAEFDSESGSALEIDLRSKKRNNFLQIMTLRVPPPTPTIEPITHTHHG